MGWWLPSLIRKRYNLCNHVVGRGQTSRQRGLCLLVFHVHSGLASAKAWLACAGASGGLHTRTSQLQFCSTAASGLLQSSSAR